MLNEDFKLSVCRSPRCIPHVEGGFLAQPPAFQSGAFPSSPVFLAQWVCVAAVFLSLWRLSALSRLAVDVADVCPQPSLLRRGAFLMLKEE